MAKQSESKNMSKTDAIRAELKKTDSPKEIAKRLNARGIKVSAQYVSTIKANDKRRQERGYEVGKPGRPRKVTTGSDADLQQANDLLLEAIELVIKAGPKKARELVNMAENILARTNR